MPAHLCKGDIPAKEHFTARSGLQHLFNPSLERAFWLAVQATMVPRLQMDVADGSILSTEVEMEEYLIYIYTHII